MAQIRGCPVLVFPADTDHCRVPAVRAPAYQLACPAILDNRPTRSLTPAVLRQATVRDRPNNAH